MKKYQRLLLVIVSVISVSLFLIYRHHYNRLHHVLEVFNFFGTPCNFSELQRSDYDLLEHDWGPQPFWQKVDSKSYIYNAFLVEKNKVQGIGVTHSNLVVPKSCLLMFEDEINPVKASYSILKMGDDKTTDFAAVAYTCTFLNIAKRREKMPFSITFKSQSEQKYVSSLLTNALDTKISFNTTVCILPSTFSQKSLFEFLSFHNLLGIDSFIIYFEQNIPYKLIKLLRNVSKILSIKITFLPYNLPLFIPNSFNKIIVEYDCQLRTKSHSKYSLVLGINEYIVPLLDIKPPTLRIPIKKFCLNHVNSNKPMILQNFELIDDYNFNEIKKVNKNNFIGNTSKNTNILRKISDVFENNCVIHKYEKCEEGVKTKTDFSVKRFSTDFMRSTLVQMLLHKEQNK